MTREQFEKYLQEIESTWELDGLKFNPEEKELIRKVCMGEITMDDYDKAVPNLDKK